MQYLSHSIRTVCIYTILLGIASTAWGFQLQFKGNPGAQANLTYSLQATVESIHTADIRHRGNATDYFFTLGPGLHAPAGDSQRIARHDTSAAEILYTIVDSSGSAFTSTQGASGSFAASNGWQEVSIDYTVVLEPGQFPEAGSYEDEVELLLYDANGPSGAPTVSKQPLRLRITMDQVVDMQIFASGESYGFGSPDYTLSYDILLPGESRSAELGVLANVSYSVELQSEHGGVLLSADSSDTINYQLQFDGNPVDLAGGGTVTAVSGQPPTSPAGTQFPIAVEILPYSELPLAGLYQDTISITVQAE